MEDLLVAAKPSASRKARIWMGLVAELLKRLGAGVGIICVPIAFMDTVGYPSVISGASMEPTLLGSDIVWINRWHVKPQAGDIFAFLYPRDSSRRFIKRVQHCEGEFVRLPNTKLFKVPENHYWMTSDNSRISNANDSKVYGPVNYGLLRGRATRIIWPPSRMRKL
ncbi:peptidase s24-like domain-containing protein [Ditylenchus destructor]|uniref:Mitochondrial inner membrane protease subunit 2 n=1 Tax=Ditylenchus destructor TaxID=166010 RepID=A0AAD4R599_9BILA|nr:peptidase s24-like domain-containing protein [Ditylenchus destructor]